jgi:hypothetical protein
VTQKNFGVNLKYNIMKKSEPKVNGQSKEVKIMPWVNLATLLSELRYSGVEPRDIRVYVNDEAVGTQPRAPRYYDPDIASETDEPLPDEYYDDEED